MNILSNKEIAKDIWQMVIEYPLTWEIPSAGQFVNLYCNHKGRLLPRPISICEVKCRKNFKPYLYLVYALMGKGTEEFSKLQGGDQIEMMAPLGNGFHIPDHSERSKQNIKNKRVLLVCGGVGTPPMIELAKTLFHRGWQIQTIMGFREEPFLHKRLAQFGDISIATDNGRIGFHGNAVQLLSQQFIKEKVAGDILFACGPLPMLQGIQKFVLQENIPAQLSLEERMGCGFGGCVGCVVKISKDDNNATEKGYTKFQYKKVCKDGPVFSAEKVIL